MNLSTDWIFLFVFLFGVILETMLLISSEKRNSKSLKISIVLLLIIFLLMANFQIMNIFLPFSSFKDLSEGFIFIFFVQLLPLSIILSTIFSIISLVKLKERKLPFLNLLLKITYGIIWIITLQNMNHLF
jgi:uncharacterized membrane protein